MFKKLVFSTVLSLFVSGVASAQIVVSDVVRIETDFQQKKGELTDTIEAMHSNRSVSKLGYTECFETLEVQGAFLCASDTRSTMNLALARASIFVEGLFGTSKGTVVTLDSRQYDEGVSYIGGHDLRSQDLLEFHKKAEESCTRDRRTCLSEFEKNLFQNFILPRAATQKDFVVITFSVLDGMDPLEVVSHEILHAQYFLSDEYRKICDAFWENELSARERDTVKGKLTGVYNTKDEVLMRNEFQAYVLMANPERHLLGAIYHKYREKLTQKLNEAGLTPVQVSQ